jgi:hypothetical protein
MSEWIVHPDGGKIALFREKRAVLASQAGFQDELRLFVAEGCEMHPDVEIAQLYLRRGGRSAIGPEARPTGFIADLYATASTADDGIRACYHDRSLFWSRSRRNRLCAYCKKDDGDWEW